MRRTCSGVSGALEGGGGGVDGLLLDDMNIVDEGSTKTLCSFATEPMGAKPNDSYALARDISED